MVYELLPVFAASCLIRVVGVLATFLVSDDIFMLSCFIASFAFVVSFWVFTTFAATHLPPLWFGPVPPCN